MRLTSIPAFRKNLVRARQIIGVLSKYGLAEWLRWVGPSFARDLLKTPEGAAIARLPWEARLRLAMTDLGPTTIKLGQFLSARPDLVGVPLADELKKLQDNVPPDRFEVVNRTIGRSLGRPLEQVFEQFEAEPIASGSIGQVHAARLRATGEQVVVKVQHPGILHKVEVDLDVLGALAQMLERFPEFRAYNPVAVVRAFRRVLMRELDFLREVRNMQRFAGMFADNPTVRIPKAFPKFCTRDVLTMERIEGLKLENRALLLQQGYNLRDLARHGARLYIEMIFSHRFYHADPHPGNILILGDNVIGLLDYGSVGHIDEALQEDIEEMLIALSERDSERLASVIARAGRTPADFDRVNLGLEVEDYLSYYGTQGLDSFDLRGALNEMIEIIRRYSIQLPPRLAVLIKVLATLEGTAKLLSPHFNLFEILGPYRTRMLRRRWSPRRQVRKMRRFYNQVERAIGILPEGFVDLFQRVQSGKFVVHLDHEAMKPSVNRVVMGLITSSLFLGSSLLVGQRIPPLVKDLAFLSWVPLVQEVSVLGGMGLAVSIVLGIRLLLAIHHSGDLG